MHSERALLDYVHDDTLHYDSVSLPYSGYEHEMTIYLQHVGHGDRGSLIQLFHELARKNFISNSSYSSVDLKLPKMIFSWKKSVVDALKLNRIFQKPNLDKMTSMTNLKVSDMIHATELEVDEKGTIATATAAIEIMPESAFFDPGLEPIKFYVNRPFLMTIRHKPTQTILFAGIIRKPI